MLNEYDLKAHAERFLFEAFGLPLEIPVKINNRLSRLAGRFRSMYYRDSGTHKPLSIDIAGYVVQYNSDKDVLQVLEHECVHYALCVLGKPFDDNDLTFINTCKALGVIQNGEDVDYKSLRHVYECPTCGKQFLQNRKVRKGYYIPCCGTMTVHTGRAVG